MKPGSYWKKHVKSEERWPIPENFRRSGVTSGYDQSGKFFSRGQFESRVAEALEALGSQIPDHLVHLMGEEDIGDPYTVQAGGLAVGVSSIEFAYMVARMHECLPTGARVVDIGSGYGGMMGKLLRYDPTIRGTCIDFPELLAVQMVYLSSIPKKNDTVFLDAGSDPGEVDAFINTRSMAEMDQDQVQVYLDLIQRRLVPGGIFYSLNNDNFISKRSDWVLDGKWKVLYEAGYPFYSRVNGVELLMQRVA